jgi:hypothetical protein
MNDLFGSPPGYGRLRCSASISPDGAYRWWLRRSWTHGGDGRCVCFVMLNPSTADAESDDPTVRRCLAYTQAWGFSTLSIRNLFALRATDPRALFAHPDPVGPRGDVELAAARTADLVVCAWGAGAPLGRDNRALALLAGKPLHCLGLSKMGHPKHPLYLRADLQPTPWAPAPP